MRKSLVFAFSLIGTIGIATATPALALGLLGRYLDRRFATSPKFLVALMLLALVLSLLILIRIAKQAAKDMEEINKNE